MSLTELEINTVIRPRLTDVALVLGGSVLLQREYPHAPLSVGMLPE